VHIEVKPLAERQLVAAYRWWRKHRDKAPEALEEDFAEALRRIGDSPGIGKFVKRQRGGIVRRYLMERVRYYLFYRINPTGDIDILQLWHSSRRPPKR
jgi:plasmid stabilization system protein ParE